MILLYLADEIHAARVLAALATSGSELHLARTWTEVQALSTTPECAVLVGRHGRDLHLDRVQQRWPAVPVVQVCNTRPEPRAGSSAHVGWAACVEREIASAVATARIRGYLAEVGERIRHAEHLPTRLRQALSHACGDGCPTSVGEVAGHLRCTPRVLSHHWRNAMPAEAGVRLEDFMGWILLLHAGAQRAAGAKWSSISEGLGTHQHTLTRTAQRLADTSLRELPMQGVAATKARFERRVVRHLVRQTLVSVSAD